MTRNTSDTFLQALLVLFVVPLLAFGEEKPAHPANDAAHAKAAFQAKFDEYKAAVRDIEKLQVDYQSADEDTRKKLNETLTGQVAHARTLVNTMVEAAKTAYRLAPNKDQQIT